jgi:N-acetylglucosaminyldiphosphoundecaprenol N-acetyl-beta-D-mannosaminyltransferase
MVALSVNQVSYGPAGHYPVGPVPIFDGDFDAAVEWCATRIRSGAGAKVATANLDFIAQARRSADLRDDLLHSDLVVADGAPVAWLARLRGGRQTRRVTGVDLTRGICEAFAGKGLRVAMYGSTPELQEGAALYLQERSPGTQLVARISPPYRALSADELAADLPALRAAEPQLVLVALGCPRQERFIADHFGQVPGALWMGVGGTFDFFAGKRSRAPKAMQAIGAEWVVRLVQEPGRLWRRYFLNDLPALAAVLPGCLAKKRVTPGP